jgi:hypothetical protein
MSEVRPQLLITLVHGTWPSGFFRTFFPGIARFKQRVRELTRRQRWDPPPFWFEEGSPFLARLSDELRDVPHKITLLLWTGKNSIHARDEAAHRLATHLSAEHAEHPQATQLIIAHSHGGNIALRALHHLGRHDASELCKADLPNPLVVTLATPFVEVQHADFGIEPTLVRIAVAAALWWPSWVLAKSLFPMGEFGKPLLIGGAVFLGFCWVSMWYLFSRRATLRRQNHVEVLRAATRLAEIASAQAQRLLILRAINDEASLVLAFSTIVNSFITKAIRFSWIIFGPIAAILLSWWSFKLSFEQEDMLKRQEWYEDAIYVVGSAFILFLFGLLSVARSAPGREVVRSPMECQINTQSAPDAKGLSEIITLVRRTYVKSLRHGIYDHEDCAKVISDWARSQLCAIAQLVERKPQRSPFGTSRTSGDVQLESAKWAKRTLDQVAVTNRDFYEYRLPPVRPYFSLFALRRRRNLLLCAKHLLVIRNLLMRRLLLVGVAALQHRQQHMPTQKKLALYCRIR